MFLFVLARKCRAQSALFAFISSLIIGSLTLDEGLFFQITSPSKLAFIYQINPSYHIGASFPPFTHKDVALIYADPPEGCAELENADFIAGELVLMERGGCPFVEKVLNAQKAGALIALVTDSSNGSDDFIDMVSDDTKRRAGIPCAWLPGNSGRRIRNYLLYEKSEIFVDIPLNYTNRSLRDTYAQKPPWELW